LPPPRPPFIRENELPLVSIVTPTYNRRDDLSRMLSCLAAQTYPRIEAVVVNDGGVPVDDIVAAFPFARLIDRPVNAGALRALEVGRAAARGEYIGVLPDDDWLYPDHVDRLMNAIFRSGAAVAHGAALLRFVERDAAGLVTVGFNNRTFSETLTPTAALVSATVGGHQMLVHRSAYDQVGGYLLDSEVSDGEMHIRLTQRYFYAFADHVTAEFRDHAGGAGRRVDFPAALRAIYESVHPVPNRPEIARKREATLRKVALREPGMPPFPISIRFGNPPASP
jgi:glycosyltransferase involved in cell wall biosynthesis